MLYSTSTYSILGWLSPLYIYFRIPRINNKGIRIKNINKAWVFYFTVVLKLWPIQNNKRVHFILKWSIQLLALLALFLRNWLHFSIILQVIFSLIVFIPCRSRLIMEHWLWVNALFFVVVEAIRKLARLKIIIVHVVCLLTALTN